MSRSKQRARATREAQQQAAARTRAAARKSTGPAPARPPVAGARAAAKGRGKPPVYRQRRFPPLPWQLKLALALLWVAVQVVTFFLVDSIGPRIAIAIISLFALPLLVVILRDPSRRPAR